MKKGERKERLPSQALLGVVAKFPPDYASGCEPHHFPHSLPFGAKVRMSKKSADVSGCMDDESTDNNDAIIGMTKAAMKKIFIPRDKG